MLIIKVYRISLRTAAASFYKSVLNFQDEILTGKFLYDSVVLNYILMPLHSGKSRHNSCHFPIFCQDLLLHFFQQEIKLGDFMGTVSGNI